MSYPAQNRLQITLLDGSHPAEKIHEDAGDGYPLCNLTLRPLNGRTAKFTQLGPGDVTCGRCEQVK